MAPYFLFFENTSTPSLPVVQSGLLLYLDAGQSSSYPGSGSTWTCLEGSGTATLQNGAVYNSSDGGYIDFSSSRYGTVSSEFTGLTQITLISFIKRVGTSQAYSPILFSRGTLTTGMNFYGTNYSLGYHWNSTVASYSWDSGLTVPLNEWVMCSVTVTSTTATARIHDGTTIQTATNSTTHSSANMDLISIARDSQFTSRNGNIYNSVNLIYNRALTLSELNENFEVFMSRYGYENHGVIAEGLQFNYDFANLNCYSGSGTTANDLATSDTATTYNSPTYSTVKGGEFSFNGSNQYILTNTYQSALALDATAAFSIEVFVKVEENTLTGYIINNRQTDASGVQYSGWYIRQGSNGHIIAGVGGYPSNVFRWRDIEITDITFDADIYNKWAHIVAVFDPNLANCKLYLNGVDETDIRSDDAGGPYHPDYSTGMRVAMAKDASSPFHYFEGEIGEARVYNRGLTSAEVLQNYNAKKDRYGLT